MSIYIKGMEMPNNCAECPVNMNLCKRCYKYLLDHMELYDQRAEDCPIIPVPPHGRLIDADALCDGLVSNHPVVIHATVAPTIIPASEDAKAEEDSEPWLCLSCRHYPPSSTDGKPCSQCNPSEVWHSCYDPASEEGE